MKSENLIQLIANRNSEMELSESFKVKCTNRINEDKNLFSSNYDMLILTSELYQSLDNQLLRILEECPKDFLDLVNLQEEEYVVELHKYLVDNKFDFIVIDEKMSNILEESILFNNRDLFPKNWTPLSNFKNNSHQIGCLGNIECYINHSINQFTSIICGKRNSLQYNFEMGSPIYEPEMNLSMKYNIQIDKKNFKLLKVFETTDDSEYINYIREKKLNYLL